MPFYALQYYIVVRKGMEGHSVVNHQWAFWYFTRALLNGILKGCFWKGILWRAFCEGHLWKGILGRRFWEEHLFDIFVKKMASWTNVFSFHFWAYTFVSPHHHHLLHQKDLNNQLHQSPITITNKEWCWGTYSADHTNLNQKEGKMRSLLLLPLNVSTTLCAGDCWPSSEAKVASGNSLSLPSCPNKFVSIYSICNRSSWWVFTVTAKDILAVLE